MATKYLSSILDVQFFSSKQWTIEYVNEYPTMRYFGIPRHTQSMIACRILTEYFWKFQ